jgi:hypothetical protein
MVPKRPWRERKAVKVGKEGERVQPRRVRRVRSWVQNQVGRLGEVRWVGGEEEKGGDGPPVGFD